MNPKQVFLSHATEDKEKFVIAYATALLSRGVNVWLDQWEMHAGDSLVEKIFTEGLGSAEAVIVVLSSVSVTKPWVREELDHAVVRRIENDAQLIPVVIDQCEVPESLRSLLQIRVAEDYDLDDIVQRTVDAIYRRSDRPPLGPAPGYLSDERAIPWPGITVTDGIVLNVLCDSAMERRERNVNVSSLTAKFQELDLSEDSVTESLQILTDENLIKSPEMLGGKIHHVTITVRAFDDYCIASVPRYLKFKRLVAARLVNGDRISNHKLVEEHGKPRLIAEQVLEALAEDGFISVSYMSGNTVQVINIRPQLRRALESEDL